MNSSDENITYTFLENEKEMVDFTELLDEFEKMQQETTFSNETEMDDIITEIKDYELNYTNKQLLLILEYYGLAKKSSHLKKSEMISYIMMFEKEPENRTITMKRKQLWYFMNELKNDKFMRRFIIS